MKTAKLIGFGISLASLLAISKNAIAASNDDNSPGYTYVMVTGSLLPQKVKIHPIGTKTAYPLRIYDRHEIDQTGRVTTEDVLAQDPSLSVVRGRRLGQPLTRRWFWQRRDSLAATRSAGASFLVTASFSA